jgi:hypothetical protein
LHSQEDEDALALQKEKASILNRIKKKLHIKKDEGGEGDTTSPKGERRAQQQPVDPSQSPSRGKSHIASSPLSDDMKLYDDSDDEAARYVPSVPDILIFSSFFLLFLNFHNLYYPSLSHYHKKYILEFHFPKYLLCPFILQKSYSIV